MSALPFHPWWHHPNHRYVGKHRGTYQYRPKTTALPYGLRSVKVTPYVDISGDPLARNVIQLPKVDYSPFKAIGFTFEGGESWLEDDDEIVVVPQGNRTMSFSMDIEDVDPQVFSMMFGEEECSQQLQYKATLLSVARRVVKSCIGAIRHTLQRVVK